MKTFILAFVMAGIIVVGSLWAANDTCAFTTDQAIVSLVNQQRITPLVIDPTLTKAAQAKAEDMAKGQYFSHTSPIGKTAWDFIREADYRYHYLRAGENLAVYFDDPSELVTTWMNSPSHKYNIVHPRFTHTGVGIAKGSYKGYETYYVVQLFALPVISQTNE